MRFKYYLRGIGLGILFATIVMTVAYEIHKSEIEISDTKVIERAEELGMVFQDSSIEGSSSIKTEGTEISEAAEVTETTEVTEADENAGNIQNEAAADGEPTDDGQADDGQVDDGQADDGQVDNDLTENEQEETAASDATITITGGTTWRQIAESLAAQGIISDSDDFWSYVIHNADGKTLHSGTYTIPAGSDYDTIISIFTS